MAAPYSRRTKVSVKFFLAVKRQCSKCSVVNVTHICEKSASHERKSLAIIRSGESHFPPDNCSSISMKQLLLSRRAAKRLYTLSPKCIAHVFRFLVIDTIFLCAAAALLDGTRSKSAICLRKRKTESAGNSLRVLRSLITDITGKRRSEFIVALQKVAYR